MSVRSVLAASAAGVFASFVAGGAEASFVGYVVTRTIVTTEERDLAVYTLAARFDGVGDTVFRAFDLSASNNVWFNGFWHKDNATDDLSEAPLSQASGSWNPRKTGSATLNRPYDSYLVIGGIANSGNTTVDETDDILEAQLLSSGWDQASLPSYSSFEWFNQQPGNGQGRAGSSAGLPSTDVRLGQFVLSVGHEARTFSLSLDYRLGKSIDGDGAGGYGGMIVTDTFTLGEVVPAPGALALLAAGGLVTVRRGRR